MINESLEALKTSDKNAGLKQNAVIDLCIKAVNKAIESGELIEPKFDLGQRDIEVQINNPPIMQVIRVGKAERRNKCGK